jgi:hypothetical protein
MRRQGTKPDGRLAVCRMWECSHILSVITRDSG